MPDTNTLFWIIFPVLFVVAIVSAIVIHRFEGRWGF